MVIIRILNNNVIKAKDRGREMIIQGKGIAFGKKAGEKFVPNEDDKIYYLNDSKEYQYIMSFIDTIPVIYWDFAAQVIDYTEKVLHKNLDSNVFFSLLDHFYIAVKRAQDGVLLNGFFSSEIKLYFKDLYDLSVKIVEMAEQAFEVTFDDSEIYFIATHLLDASLGATDTVSLERATEVIDCVVNKVTEYFSNIIDKESSGYGRFITHLKLFAGRIIASNKKDVGFFEKRKFNSMFHALTAEFPKQYECLECIIDEIRSKFNYYISDDEQFYLMLHIVKITEFE